jgi:hypothetical protein
MRSCHFEVDRERERRERKRDFTPLEAVAAAAAKRKEERKVFKESLCLNLFSQRKLECVAF